MRHRMTIALGVLALSAALPGVSVGDPWRPASGVVRVRAQDGGQPPAVKPAVPAPAPFRTERAPEMFAQPLLTHESFMTPESCGFWSAGAGLLFAKPFFENNPAYTIGRYQLHTRVIAAPIPPPEPPPGPGPVIPPPDPPPPPPTPPPIKAPVVTKKHFLASEFVMGTTANGKPVLQSKSALQPTWKPATTPIGGATSGTTTTGSIASTSGTPSTNPGAEGSGSNPPAAAAQPQQQPAFLIRDRYLHAVRRVDFDPDFEFSPRAWLEWRGSDGIGVRGRFWRFEQHLNEIVFNPAPGVNGEAGEVEVRSADPLGLQVHSPGPLLAGLLDINGTTVMFAGVGADLMLLESSLLLWTVDLEATVEGELGAWLLLSSGGLRYAHLAQSYNVFRFNQGTVPGVAGVTADAAVLMSGHQIKGLGPTVALEAKRPIGDHGLCLYGQARGSILFGKNKHTAHQASVLSGQAAAPFFETSFMDATASHNDVLPVAELEAGVEWNRDLERSTVFVQTGLFAQTWFGAGGAASEEGNLGFFGLSLSLGLRF
jgi:hypothetical protein